MLLRRNQFIALTLFSLAAASFVSADDWPAWRGSTGQGFCEESMPLKWSKTDNVRWKVTIPGRVTTEPIVQTAPSPVVASVYARHAPQRAMSLRPREDHSLRYPHQTGEERPQLLPLSGLPLPRLQVRKECVTGSLS
jgi:hypothetical protein